MRMKANPGRREILSLLNAERDYIMDQARRPGADPPTWSLDDLSWYLGIARNWGLLALHELAQAPDPGELLDVGAYYCLASGAATRLGWRPSGLDIDTIPNYSGLASRSLPSAVCNICSDPIPFDDNTFDAVFFLEVLEHLPYPYARALREMRRVLRPKGRLYLSTPNAAGIGRIRLLVMGKNHEPVAETFMLEDDTFDYKGRTYFRSGREHRLWTMPEVEDVVSGCGFRVVKKYFYNTTVYDSNFPSRMGHIAANLKFWIQPLIRRIRILGSGLFLVAEPLK